MLSIGILTRVLPLSFPFKMDLGEFNSIHSYVPCAKSTEMANFTVRFHDALIKVTMWQIRELIGSHPTPERSSLSRRSLPVQFLHHTDSWIPIFREFQEGNRNPRVYAYSFVWCPPFFRHRSTALPRHVRPHREANNNTPLPRIAVVADWASRSLRCRRWCLLFTLGFSEIKRAWHGMRPQFRATWWKWVRLECHRTKALSLSSYDSIPRG